MFVKLRQELFMGSRTLPAGSVVEINDKDQVLDWERRGIATPHAGPAFENVPSLKRTMTPDAKASIPNLETT